MPEVGDWKLLLARAAEEPGALEIGPSGDRVIWRSEHLLLLKNHAQLARECTENNVEKTRFSVAVPITRSPDHGDLPILCGESC